MKHVYSYARVSSKKQIVKSGLERQEKLAKDWADKNGYTFTKAFKDKGLSAHKGNHATFGELAEFIAQVNGGVIPKGSILAVESMDRLSRQEILPALAQFTNFLTAGVEIYTIIDDQYYTYESVNKNPMQLLISITLMSGAHKESHTKSVHIKEARNKKHAKAIVDKNTIITKQLPFWLDVKQQDNINVIGVNDYAKTVELIFDQALKGQGSINIARYLNDNNIKCYPNRTKTKSKHNWNAQKLTRILNNERVTGLFISSNSNPNIANYFPAVINKSDFLKVQALIKQRTKTRAKSSKTHNVFSGLLKCGCCDAGIQYAKMDSGNFEKSGRMLRCNRRQMGESCSLKAIHYFPFEQTILSALLEFNLDADEVPIDDTIVVKTELHELEMKVNNINKAIEQGAFNESLLATLQTYNTRILELEQSLKAIELLKHSSDEIEYSDVDIITIQDVGNSEIRAKAASNLRAIIDCIKIYNTHYLVLLHSGVYYLLPKYEIREEKEATKNSLINFDTFEPEFVEVESFQAYIKRNKNKIVVDGFMRIDGVELEEVINTTHFYEWGQD